MLNVSVHQVLPNMEYGDAITNYALILRQTIRQLGYRSNIYAQYIHPKLRRFTYPLTSMNRLVNNSKTIWIYHHSIASEITRQLREVKGRVVLIYHNITPPAMSLDEHDYIASRLYAGLEELKSFMDVPVVAVGSSKFNESQLKRVGFPKTEIVPIIINYDFFERPVNRRVLLDFNDDKINFITVSRIYPHKKIEDVLRIFYYYYNLINSNSRMFIIGDHQGSEWYHRQLLELHQKLNLPNVIFTGRVRFRELLAYYKLADVYLCMSEHEGFGVPLLESMYMGVPIIAYNCSAVSETLGDAGVLVNQKRCSEIAEMAHLLVTDEDFRTRVINKQKDRALYFQPDALVARLQKVLSMAMS